MTDQVAEIKPPLVGGRRSRSPVNNYVRAGSTYLFFDDTDELAARRVFKLARDIGGPITLYRILPWGWVSYTGGAKVIMVCPEEHHVYVTSSGLTFCLHCGVKEAGQPEEEDA